MQLVKLMWMVRLLRKRINIFHKYQSLTLDLILELLEQAYVSELYLDKRLTIISEQVLNEFIEELRNFEKNGKIDLSKKIKLRDQPVIYRAMKDIEQREWHKFTEWAWLGARVIQDSMAQTYQVTTEATYDMFKAELYRPGLHEPLHSAIISKDFIIENKLNIPWCQDGKIYSERLYQHIEQFQLKLSYVLEEGIGNGKGIDWMIDAWRKLTGSTIYDASRLLKTETMAMWALATKDAYLNMGIEYVEIVNPEPCDEVCSDYVGEIIPLAEAELGDELPPYHPNCMCDFFAFYEDNGQD